jgi:hypothetical protein
MMEKKMQNIELNSLNSPIRFRFPFPQAPRLGALMRVIIMMRRITMTIMGITIITLLSEWIIVKSMRWNIMVNTMVILAPKWVIKGNTFLKNLYVGIICLLRISWKYYAWISDI